MGWQSSGQCRSVVEFIVTVVNGPKKYRCPFCLPKLKRFASLRKFHSTIADGIVLKGLEWLHPIT